MIDSLFDRVIVISLPCSERREHIRQHFADTKITNYEFFDAINGAELDLPALKRDGILADKPAEHGGTDLSPGEVGCAWSHIRVYESALARRLKRVLVCEDDVQFCAGPNEVIAGYMAEMPRNWDIIHFMSNRAVGSGDKLDVYRKKITEHVYLGYNEGAGAACYALTRRCMNFLLRYAYPINKAADGLTNWPSGWWKECRGYQGYIVTPLPATTSAQFTTQIGDRPSVQGIQSPQTGVVVKYLVKAPAVDVVIVNWNYGRFVANAIQSVKDQSYQNFRCIVVDNGSDDDSADRIAEAIGNHPQFTFHRLPTNLGHLGAALWSLEHSTGEFITFLDADDVLFPNYLASHLQAHLAAGSSVSFTSSNCVDMNADGVLLTSGNWNMYHFWQHGTPTLRPMERTVRLTGVDDSGYSALAQAVRYLPAHTVHWCWCPGSSNMFRRALLDRIRPKPSPALFGGVDGFFLPILHALTGSILIDQPLSAYRHHGSNDYSMLPSIQGLSSEHPKVKVQGFGSYMRMLIWLVDHLDEVVLMTGAERYWQILATAASSTPPFERAAFAQPELQAALVRQYSRHVKLFGELRIFQELRRRLLFLEYLKIMRAAHGRPFPIAALSRAFLREIVRRGWLLYRKIVNRSK